MLAQKIGGSNRRNRRLGKIADIASEQQGGAADLSDHSHGGVLKIIHRQQSRATPAVVIEIADLEI